MWFLRSFALWRDQQINLFSFFGLLAAPGVSWGPPGGPPGAPGGLLGVLLGASWGLLAASLDLLRRSWSLVGLMLGFPNPIWALQGINFGPAGAHFGFPGDQNRQKSFNRFEIAPKWFPGNAKIKVFVWSGCIFEKPRSSRSFFQKDL